MDFQTTKIELIKEILEIERGIKTIKCCYFNKPLFFGFLTSGSRALEASELGIT